MLGVRHVVWAVLPAFAVAGAAAAEGLPENPLIGQGIALYEDMEYEASVDALQRALVRAENLPEQKILIFKYLALDYLVLGRAEDARQAFRQLLAIQPEFELDATFSPAHRGLLEGVREQWEVEGRPGWVPIEARLPAVTFEHALPASAERGSGLDLRVRAVDPAGRAERLVLAYRPGGSTEFTRLELRPQPGGLAGATIPGDAVEPPVIEYYFEAIDGAGRLAGRMGDAGVPLRVPVPGEEEGILSKWWFWTAIGVAVAASVAIPVAIVMTGDDGGSGDPATVTFVLCEPGAPCPP